MTRTIEARFDGHVLVPTEPVDLPVDEPLRVTVEPISTPAPAEKLPIFGDPNRSLEEKLAALDEMYAHGVHGVNLPDEALRRENIYGDDGR